MCSSSVCALRILKHGRKWLAIFSRMRRVRAQGLLCKARNGLRWTMNPCKKAMRLLELVENKICLIELAWCIASLFSGICRCHPFLSYMAEVVEPHWRKGKPSACAIPLIKSCHTNFFTTTMRLRFLMEMLEFNVQICSSYGFPYSCLCLRIILQAGM